jgi:hypothetical protein
MGRRFEVEVSSTWGIYRRLGDSGGKPSTSFDLGIVISLRPVGRMVPLRRGPTVGLLILAVLAVAILASAGLGQESAEPTVGAVHVVDEREAERVPGNWDVGWEGAECGLLAELWRVPIGYERLSESGRYVRLGAIARAHYLHDQRWEFMGTESSFGVESQLFGTFDEPVAIGRIRLTAELYLTQPFDQNILVDYPERQSFQHNFDVDPFEISQLSVDWCFGDWTVTAGRFVTPFGRYYYPLFSNNRSDSHFIRTEAILFRETGLQLAWNPSALRTAVAMTNGSDGLDTNSSKAVVARCGVDFEHFVGGVSVKWQDGIGSEGQKQFNNHAGFDWLVRSGCWGLAGEFIYDQYGMRRPGLDLDDITWGRSLYNRQLNIGWNEPMSGVGYYAGVIYHDACQTWTLSYGQFFPESVGDPIHDEPTHRLMGQLHWRCGTHLSHFTSAFWENEVPQAQAGRARHGFYVLTGLQYAF